MHCNGVMKRWMLLPEGQKNEYISFGTVLHKDQVLQIRKLDKISTSCVLPVWWLEQQKKVQAFDRSQTSSKSRNFMHLQRTHIPTLVTACKKLFSANTSKPKSFRLFTYKDDFISKWSSNNQHSTWLMSIILEKLGIILWVNKEKQQLKPSEKIKHA